MLLIIFEDNWADEMDIYGFSIMSQEKWKYKVNETNNTTFPREVYFGTNEFNIYETPDEFLSRFKVKHLKTAEFQILIKLFGREFGKFLVIEGLAPDEFYEKNGYCPER